MEPFCCRFVRRPESVATARRTVAAVLDAWGLGCESDRALLIVSELATNAVLHTTSPTFDLICRFEENCLVIGVKDNEPLMSQCRDGEEAGRGLVLVEALAESWGYSPRPDGKLVWASLDLEATTADLVR